MPRIGASVDVDAVEEGLADEAELLVRRREASSHERAAVRWVPGREQDERVGAALDLGGGTRHERSNGLRVLRRRNEVGDEAGGHAVLEGVTDGRDTGELVSPIRAEAAVVTWRVDVAPADVL